MQIYCLFTLLITNFNRPIFGEITCFINFSPFTNVTDGATILKEKKQRSASWSHHGEFGQHLLGY